MTHHAGHQASGDKATSGGGMSRTMMDCVQECRDCAQICAETIQHCLQKGGKHADPAHIKLLMDCVEICETSASFMIRGSEHHDVTCGACAEICKACAESCEKMADDPQMKKCAEACRRCADSCAQMSAA